MLKQAGLLAVALGALLVTQPARAGSPYDQAAYTFLKDASDAANTRQNGSLGGGGIFPTPYSYWAMVYLGNAEYFASYAMQNDDKTSWFYAFVYGYYGTLYAQQDYQQSRSPWSNVAATYGSWGYVYAYGAYIDFQ